MHSALKIILLILILFPIQITIVGQNPSFNITPELRITSLSDNVFIHTHDNSNGIVFTDQDEAVLVSTPPSDEVTLDLINWVKDSLQKKIIAYVIDRWHPDAMEGLDVVHKLGIHSYSYELTRSIAVQKGLPIPQTGFNPMLEIKVGKEKIICHYFGPAHTDDGIVVYLPSEKILFGGNEVRNYKGWIGNIADATLDEWSNTITKVKESYGMAEIVVPGHGPHGGPELLDYTIELYAPFKDTQVEYQDNEAAPIFKNRSFILNSALRDTLIDGVRTLIDAQVMIDKGDQYIILESPLIEVKAEGKSFQSASGKIRIIKLNPMNSILECYGIYKQLYIDLREDEVKMTIVMRELNL